jgi:DNA gyrase/topoisomerase IV subunit A
VDEYENRIASLEYQLELLKRQLGGEVVLPIEAPPSQPAPEMLSLMLYNPLGQVLRAEVDPLELSSGHAMGSLKGTSDLGEVQPAILAAPSQEELLLIFTSGRTVAMPASSLAASPAENLDWQQAYLEEPRIKEELAAIQPIARMALYEYCIQVSRRGYVKKMRTSFFTSHAAEGYIGTGVKLPADRTYNLAFAGKDDLFVMVSQEGYIFSMTAERLPTAIEEVVHLGITDHIVAAFTVSQKPSILFVAQTGKAVHRDTSWLEPASTFKTKGQALLSRERREAGTRIVGAAPVGEGDWGVFLHNDGTLSAHQLNQLLADGSMERGWAASSIVSITTFHMPEVKPEPSR